jgi:hypothetical protein
MRLSSRLRRAVAVATVAVGIALFTLAVQGVTRVDTRLELAAVEQVAPQVADCPFRDRAPKHDRERV